MVREYEDILELSGDNLYSDICLYNYIQKGSTTGESPGFFDCALLSTFKVFNVFSPVSHQQSLQNLDTKDLATTVIQTPSFVPKSVKKRK